MNLVVIVLFGYTLYDDIITCPKGSINWHGIFLKLLAICSSAGMSRGEGYRRGGADRGRRTEEDERGLTAKEARMRGGEGRGRSLMLF